MVEYCTEMVYSEKEVLDDIGNKPYDPMVDGEEERSIGRKEIQITRSGREHKLLGAVFLILGVVSDVQNNELEAQISSLMQSGTTILSTNFFSRIPWNTCDDCWGAGRYMPSSEKT